MEADIYHPQICSHSCLANLCPSGLNGLHLSLTVATGYLPMNQGCGASDHRLVVAGAYVAQWSWEPCCAGSPKTDGSSWGVLTKSAPLEEGMANHSSILAKRPHEKYKKAKRYDTRRWAPPGQISNMLLGKSGGQLRIAPKRMKRLSQSGNGTHLWMYLVMKVQCCKNNIA